VSRTCKTKDIERWRARAEKMRALAGTMTDPNAAILMNDLAADYDKLAERTRVKGRRQNATVKRQVKSR
jgi:hypothetical protein